MDFRHTWTSLLELLEPVAYLIRLWTAASQLCETRWYVLRVEINLP